MNKDLQNILHLFYDVSPLIITHTDSKDVCFEIVNIKKGNEDWSIETQTSIKLIGFWLNLGFKDSFLINNTENGPEQETIEIQVDDIKKWLWCSEPDKKCLRDSTWESLKARDDG